MINYLPRTMAFGLLLFIFGCSDNANITNLPQSQKQFCEVISKYRDLYQIIEDKDKYIDQENDLTAIFIKRKNALKKTLKNGQVEQWRGVIDDMTIGGEGVYLKVKLPCSAHMATNDRLVISNNSLVYQSLRSYSEDSKITFSGTFLVPTGSETDKKYPYESYYSEDSFTVHGSMIDPGFHFRYTQFH